MKIELIALLIGIVTGGVFTLFKLPLPAPPTMSGILGIVGIFLGSKLVQSISSTNFAKLIQNIININL